jgi:hypothetical protein
MTLDAEIGDKKQKKAPEAFAPGASFTRTPDQ